MRSRGEDPPESRGVDNRLASLGQCRGLPYIGDLGRQRGWCVDFRSSRPPSPPHKLLRTYDTIQYSTGQVIHDIDIRNPIIRWSSANSTYGTASGRRKGQPIRNHRLERVRLGWKRVKHKMCTCAWWRGGEREGERAKAAGRRRTVAGVLAYVRLADPIGSVRTGHVWSEGGEAHDTARLCRHTDLTRSHRSDMSAGPLSPPSGGAEATQV
jgi:hypothetical protein